MSQVFASRKHKFSDFWFVIFQARLLLALLVLVFSKFTTPASHFKAVLTAIALYLSINVTLGFVNRVTLRRKRVRAVPAIVDVAFVSCLVYLTGGGSSPWYLFYVFPILSVSRYLSYEGSVTLALIATAAYTTSSLLAGSNAPPVILKSLILLGISFVAGNLSRTRQRKDDDLVDIFRAIDNAIIDDVATDEILKMILKRAVAFTESTMGQMTVFDEDQFAHFVSIKADEKQPDWQVQALAVRYQAQVKLTKQPLSILTIKQKKASDNGSADEIAQGPRAHIYVLRAFVEYSENMPQAAFFVPLILSNEVRAIISLYSKKSFHYFDIDAVKLGSLAPALGIALKHSSEVEKTQRLKLLHQIGETLKVEQGLSEIFETVVKLTFAQLGSEEAALFVSDDKGDEIQIRKVAVKGPSVEITEELRKIEKPYKPGESLVGEIFESREIRHLHDVPSSTQNHKEYSLTLPSGNVRHYIGVPIVIGDQVLGVLRVINQRSSTYSIPNQNFKLTEGGFGSEDVELMQTIASQVASAIRSAKFIELHRNYKELVENSPDPIIVLDPSGRIMVFNKACQTVWRYKAEEVIGQHVTNYYETAAHAREIGALLEVRPDHRLRDFEARIKAFDGEIIPISLSASLLFDFRGEKVGSIGVFKDLRDTQRLQAEKTNAERLATLGKLAHTVGHEIKHNIATALNFVDTLEYESSDDQELSEIYHDIQDSLREAVDKFQNMLMVGRPKPPDKEVINAEDLFRRAETQMRRRADAKKIDFLVDYEGVEHEVNADIAQLWQVLFNLFDNSIDAIDSKNQTEGVSEKGRIELSAHASNGDLVVVWKDNGCGISQQALAKIFTPFVTYKQTGNGLGLFIVKNIIENHGGDISVESEEGAGTSFKIVLPLSHEAPSP